MNSSIPNTAESAAQAVRVAREYRAESNRHDGITIICRHEVSGWMNALRNPEYWMPGCIAVDNHNQCWVASGGNECDGAECWELITLSTQRDAPHQMATVHIDRESALKLSTHSDKPRLAHHLTREPVHPEAVQLTRQPYGIALQSSNTAYHCEGTPIICISRTDY